MFDINSISAFALDMAGSGKSYERQEQLADLVWSLLDKDYQIFLFSSNQKEDLQTEYFQHPRLRFLEQPVPPSDQLTEEIPQLKSSHTLWVTEDAALRGWLNEQKLKLAYRTGGEEFGDRAIRIGSPRDLAVLFDPSGRTVQEIGEAILARLEGRREGAFLVGIGGPPMSGLPEFTVELRGRLQSLGCPVVDLLDVSPFLSAEEGEAPWSETPGGLWLLDEVIGPLRAGKRVFVEELPQEGVPKDFESHLPLFLSEESVVLVMGERLFVPAVTAALDVTILLEVSARETARRLYEIPAAQPFDAKFIDQYLQHEGKAYKAYLEGHRVAENVMVRVSAEIPGRLSISHLAIR
jgi:hypothetical protein